MVNRCNKTGRSKGNGRYVLLPHSIMETFAWSRLSSNAKVAWLEFGRIHNGANNGRLAMSARVLGKRLAASQDTAARAIRELIKYGFLEITKSASFSGKRRAAEYRMTHLSDDHSGKPPSRTFQSIGKAVAADLGLGSRTIVKLQQKPCQTHLTR
jgi:hypothetical protein